MRRDIDHLPQGQQDELARVQHILMAEFERAISLATQPERKNGKILKIILFGSYARTDWVDDPENGYQSDFDLLIVVSDPKLTAIEKDWYIAEDKIYRDPAIGRPVNIIVHSLDQVNQSLRRGEYFWVDISRDGIALYELSGHTLGAPMPLTPADAYEMSNGYFSDWLKKVESSIKIAAFCIAESELNDAAYNYHQATERAYICYLLTKTLYYPRSHNIKFLRSLAEDNDPRLMDAWPRKTGYERKRFQLVKRSYVDGRYSKSYAISVEDLTEIGSAVRKLRDLVEAVCLENLEKLRLAVGEGASTDAQPD